MGTAASINPRIIEGLYCESLVLSDEVRGAFALSGRIDTLAGDDDEVRLALSCEALRTTTRMMHAVAWLLNHRAYLAGNLSEVQLRRYGKLHPCAGADPDRLAMLGPELQDLIRATELFYARLMRLDEGWRTEEAPALDDVFSLQRRLGMRARG